MAKGQTIGLLNFGIGGDDAEIQKIFEKQKKQAKELQDLYKSIGFGNAKEQKAAYKSMMDQQRKNAVNVARIGEIQQRADDRSLLNQQRLLTEVQRTEAAKRRAANVGVHGQNQFNAALGMTNKTIFSQRNLLQQLSNAAGIYFSIYQAGSFIKELAMISGEFEKQRLSLAAIIQDQEASTKIFNQIKDLAVYSPFNFKELTDYAKQLSAFSIPANEIFDTMKRLADVSAGLGVDMNRIILAYGQVRSASVLRGQELRQFTEAGIPLVDELAKKFGELENRVVSAGDVFDKISGRQVPFAMIKDIFEELTNEGGKFFEMQEIQAKSLSGMISNLRDAYDIMLDSIGQANMGFMKDVVGGLVGVMDNWQKYLDILKTVIASVGVYRASIIAASIANGNMAKSIKVVAAAQAMMTKFSSINPYALALAGVTALIGGLVTLVAQHKRLERELLTNITAINKQSDAVNKLINELKGLAKSTDDAGKVELKRLDIIKELSVKEPLLSKAIKEHADNLDELNNIQERYNSLIASQKFAQYAISETRGLFGGGIESDITKMTDAQNKADASAIKLDNTYSKIVDKFKEIKEIGGAKWTFGIHEVNPETLSSYDKIINSTSTYAEKVKQIYMLLSSDKSKAGKNITNSIFEREDLSNITNYSMAMTAFAGSTEKANNRIDELAKSLELNFKNKGIDIADPANADMLRAYIKDLQALEAYGQKRILTSWGIKFTAPGGADTLEGWRKEVQDVLGSTVTIQPDLSMPDAIKAIRDEYDKVKKEIEDQKPLLVKMGFDFQSKEIPLIWNEIGKSTAQNYIDNEKHLERLILAANLLNIVLNNKENKKEEDTFTRELKRQIGLIKDAKSEYEKLLKVMSPDEAGAKIKSMTAYSGIDVNNLTNEGYVAYLTDAISKISNRATDAAKDTRMAWNKEIAQIEVEGVTEKFKNEFTAIEKYLSQYKEQYSLYEQLFGITGDKSGSLKSAFGDPSFAIKSVSDVLKEQMSLLPETSDEWRKLNDEVNSLEWSEKADFSKAMADLVAKYKSDEDKITAIKANGEEQRIKILENADNATDEVIQQRLAANKKATEESVSEIESESLKLTDFYQKLFGNLGDYGDRTLKSIINKTKDIISLLQNAEKNSEGKYDIEVDGKKITVSENDIARIIKRYGEAEKEMRKKNPFKTLANDLKAYSDASTKEEKSEALDKLSVSIAAAGELAQQLGGDLSNMLSALGGEEAADAIGFVGELAGSISSLASGIASGNPVQMIQGIIGGIASIVNFHDKRLDRAIQKSQLEVKKLENAYANLERTIERQLGGTTKDQYKAQLDNLQKQRDELDKQRQAELKKKKVDKEAVLDYENQIKDLDDTIKFFAEDLAKTLYDIDFKSWASDITSAIVDAFASGEDAVKAFDDTVADIMRNVIKNMIALEVLGPAMESVREYLFGKNGQGGVLGDGEFSENDAKGLVGVLAGLKDRIKKSQDIWDALNEAAEEAGIDLGENKNKDTLGASIQGLTENTGSLVASYLNAMRADLAQQKAMVERIAMSMENGSVWFAQIHARLVAIEINTRETADISAEIRELANKTHNILKDVTTSGSPTKMNIR